MMRQTFKFRRMALACTLLAMLLLVVNLTIQQSRSATTVRDNTTSAATALSTPDSGAGKEMNAQGIETFVEDERHAIVLLYEHNPWAMVLGSDSPTFAMYDDGLVIFARTNQEGRPEYASVILSEKERADFLAALPVKQFNELRHEYELDLMTDQPTTVLSVGDKTGLKSVRVYGNLRRSARENDPRAFIEIYRKLKSFADARAVRWMPERIELMIWPYENAGEPLPWPKNWPDTAHPTTKKRGTSKDSINYSIYLMHAQYERLRKQVESKSADALLINNHKWAFSFRFPFPNEESWRKRASDS
jgi:hypothetical protein